MSLDLVIVGDEAWGRDELDRRQKRREYERDYKRRRYQTDPDYRARQIAAVRRWKERHRDGPRVYNRQWMRRKRGNKPILVASLHSLACSGPTKPTGCRCNKIRCYDKPR